MNNDERVKEMLEKEPVPKELEPENIKAMLDRKNAEKAAEKKRSGISVAGRLVAAAAACAVIGGGSYAYLSGTKPSRLNKSSDPVIEETTLPKVEQTAELFSQQAYMSGAKDYSQIYELMKLSSENQKKAMEKYGKSSKKYSKSSRKYDFATDDVVEEAEADDVYEDAPQAADTAPAYEEVSSAEPVYEDNAGGGAIDINDYQFSDEANYDANDYSGSMSNEDEEQIEYSDTYNQEENVLEADIAKTDGKYIYYISNSDNGQYSPVLRSAKAKDGKFLSSHSTYVDIKSFYEDSEDSNSYVEDMYLYNDMIVIIGDTFDEWYATDNYQYKQSTYVAFYTTGDSPELIDVYFQDGSYQDVRIAPDGYMYLVTSYASDVFENIQAPDDYQSYIPQCGLSQSCGLIPPDDILLPPENKERDLTYVNFSVIGSIDLNNSEAPSPVDQKALTDYTGQLYASEGNFYTAAYHGNETDLTRIAVSSGSIAPAASATVDGYVKDQFSMSEYNGYFRVAVTRNTTKQARWWEKLTDSTDVAIESIQDNAVYVFDMDMNKVGSIGDFGKNESIKSVNFQGDIAYVVTYERTDPLFAIDLSDPKTPTILDEFKINGYSTYMQKWSDGLLLGFGVNADENAIETGIKLVMFDNSDPENLKEVGFWSLDRDDSGNSWVYSQAVSERKALFIAPEKNLIGIPVQTQIYDGDDEYYYGNWEYNNKYIFLSYENGRFVEKGTIEAENNDFFDDFIPNRAMYIGDYLYVLSGSRFIAADINTIEVTDELDFRDGDRIEEPTVTETTVTSTEVTATETTAETTETTSEAAETTTEEATEPTTVVDIPD